MCRRYTTNNWKEIPGVNREMTKITKKCSNIMDHDQSSHDGVDQRATYISFSSNSYSGFEIEKKPLLVCDKRKQWEEFTMKKKRKNSEAAEVISLSANQSPASSGFSNFDENGTDLFGSSDDHWEELRSIVDFAFDPFLNNP